MGRCCLYFSRWWWNFSTFSSQPCQVVSNTLVKCFGQITKKFGTESEAYWLWFIYPTKAGIILSNRHVGLHSCGLRRVFMAGKHVELEETHKLVPPKYKCVPPKYNFRLHPVRLFNCLLNFVHPSQPSLLDSGAKDLSRPLDSGMPICCGSRWSCLKIFIWGWIETCCCLVWHALNSIVGLCFTGKIKT